MESAEKQAKPEENSRLDREHFKLLLEVNNALVSNLDFPSLFRAISVSVGRVVQHDYSSLCLYDEARDEFRVYALVFPGGKGLIHEQVAFKLAGSPAGDAFKTRKPLVLARLDEHRYPNDSTGLLLAEGITSACWLPLIRGGHCFGVLCVGSHSAAQFHAENVATLFTVANQVAIAVENALAFRQIQELKERLATEKSYLENELRAERYPSEMVGASPQWRAVLGQVETVAPTDATVLILGETGTGKELVARAIHDRSLRRARTFVKVSCAAVPTGLLESELFGHERGAFTGAIARQTGRFELAHQGTLMLDEVGDLPLELQPKLLRALQEQQFERLGSSRTIHVDVRIVAATNRDLRALLEQGQFREDLFYRLNVFPIALPPLRERRSDIPLLAAYFVQKYAAQMRKQITTIPSRSMDCLMKAEWPGNIRELQNFIERSVILTRGSTLEPPLAELRGVPSARSETLRDKEREYIAKIVRECNGVIGGPFGAATRLGLKRTTLNARLRKLGLRRESL